MAIRYVDTNRQHATFTPSSKQNFIDTIETYLLAAGWTTISGHGTTNLLMQSAATPEGLQGRLRIKDNAGNCIVLSIENTAGTLVGGNSTTAGIQLNPGSGLTYRIIANKYQAFIFTGQPTPARQFAAFGVLALPAFLAGVITTGMWICGNANNDTDTTIRNGFRTRLVCHSPNVAVGANFQVMCNANIWESANGNLTGSTGVLSILAQCFISEVVRDYSWHDDSANITDVLLCWGLTGNTALGKIRGQMWDAMLASESYTGDLTTTADSHNWIAITDGNAGVVNNLYRGTIFLAIP
jgi:hypothetical protein